MTRGQHPNRDGCAEDSSGFGGFLRGLLRKVPWSERAEDVVSYEFPRPTGGTLRVENINGKTLIVGESRDDIEVKAFRTARAESEQAARKLLDSIRVVASGGQATLELEVEIPKRWNRHGSAHLEIRIPTHLELQLFSSNGGICAQNVEGDVRARSSNGSVSLSNVMGAIDCHTSNGKISCENTCGRLVARSSNRKIEIEEHRGSLDAMTSNGLIHASLEELGPEGVVLATSNGRIVLELPEKCDADVDMRVDNGLIRNGRDFDTPPTERAGRVRGQLGRGGIAIKLRTSNGSISLR